MPVNAPQWTPETARQAGLKSAANRAQLASEVARLTDLIESGSQLVKVEEPKPEPEPASQPVNRAIQPQSQPNFKTEQLEIVAEQITRTREELNSQDGYCPACERAGVEPHHRAQLLKALDALLDRQRILHGEPMPGSRRPAQERSVRSGIMNGLPDRPS